MAHSSDSSDDEIDTPSTPFYILSLLYILFLISIPVVLYYYEFQYDKYNNIKLLMLDNNHIFKLSGARYIDLNTQSKVIGRLVLIPDEPEFDQHLYIPSLNLYLNRTIAAKIIEEEIEENLPGIEQERELDWVEKNVIFNGFSVGLLSGSVFIGPFALSDSLISQYLKSQGFKILHFDDEKSKNITSAEKFIKHDFTRHPDGKHFYRTESTPMDYRFSVHSVPMIENITILAIVGSDKMLYPASLLGVPLDEFYEGTKSLDDIVSHFDKTSVGPLKIPLYFFRVLIFVWVYSLVYLLTAFYNFKAKRRNLVANLFSLNIVLTFGFGLIILGTLWLWISSSNESLVILLSGTALIIFTWALNSGTKNKIAKIN